VSHLRLGIHNDLARLVAPLVLVVCRRVLMPVAWRIDLLFVRLHTWAFEAASRAERRMRG
jgi:hypothetical protein